MTFKVRPARNEDFQAIYQLAKYAAGHLPIDMTTLVSKLMRSEEAFAGKEEARNGCLFLFVLEKVDTSEIVGSCQIFSRVGLDMPFYSYRLSTLTQTSRELGRTFRAEMLTLCTDLEESSEVGGLILHAGARGSELGSLLARSRYLFIRQNRSHFANTVIAELRGVTDEAGDSPFWDAVAGRFLGMGFKEADAFNSAHGSAFIADLLPKAPIYTATLPERTRNVMGVPHPTGHRAMRRLKNEGFSNEGYIDIFDGGPIMRTTTDDIRTVREARALVLGTIEDRPDAKRMMLSAGGLSDFVAGFGRITAERDGRAILDPESAAMLGLSEGDPFLAVEA